MAGKGPQFITYMKPIINVLKEMGGAGKSSEVIDEVIELLKIPDGEIQVTNKNGGSKGNSFTRQRFQGGHDRKSG